MLDFDNNTCVLFDCRRAFILITPTGKGYAMNEVIQLLNIIKWQLSIIAGVLIGWFVAWLVIMISERGGKGTPSPI